MPAGLQAGRARRPLGAGGAACGCPGGAGLGTGELTLHASCLLFCLALLFLFFSFLFLSLPRALSLCKVQERCSPAGGKGGGSLVLSCLFFLKQNSEVLGKGEAESKKGEAEPTSSPSYSSKMKKDFKASDPARRV